MGLWLRVLQGGIQALIFLGISTPQSMIGLEVLQPRAKATKPPECRACGETPRSGHPPPSPYLELSRP